MRIDLQRLFSMVPREEELEPLLGSLDAVELYEIHITVKSDGEIEQFKECCAELEVKPLVVQLANGAIPDDVMTSSSIRCTPSDLRDECIRILIALEVMGWRAVRCKIETPPFHSKVVGLKPEDILPTQYFEAHLPVRISNPQQQTSLDIFCKAFGVYQSANAFKVNDGVRTIMATIRSAQWDAEVFKRNVDAAVTILSEKLFCEVETPVVEFAIFDSNRSHDNEWIKR